MDLEYSLVLRLVGFVDELYLGRGELQLSIVLDGLGMECLRHSRCCHNVDLTQERTRVIQI